MKTARERLLKAQRVVVLTGAGISAASGIPTFRGADGLWRNYRPEDLATPQAYRRDPQLVWEWYAMRYGVVSAAEPNEAHRLLVALQERIPQFTLVTQNVDGLHARAGSTDVLELHGNITHCRCESCGHLDKLEVNFALPPHCAVCGSRARPNVVWFGETLPEGTFGAAYNAFAWAEVALVIGTSSVVYPAASLAQIAAAQGALVIEINPETTPLSAVADVSVRAGAVEGLKELLEGGLG